MNNLRFPGQYYDEATKLNYNYFRYYDPATGRYITSDPIGLLGGINTYAYALNNPIILLDRLGLAPLSPDGKHGLPGGTIGPRAGSKLPGPSDKAKGFAAKQILKKIADMIAPGAGKLVGSSPLGAFIGGITFSPGLGGCGSNGFCSDTLYPPLPPYEIPDPYPFDPDSNMCPLN